MRKIARWVLIFIITLHAVAFIAGCNAKPQPKAWLSVEKKPMKVIYVDYHNDISPQTAKMVIDRLSLVPFRETDIKENTGILIDWDADVHGSYSDTKTLEIK